MVPCYQHGVALFSVNENYIRILLSLPGLTMTVYHVSLLSLI